MFVLSAPNPQRVAPLLRRTAPTAKITTTAKPTTTSSPSEAAPPHTPLKYPTAPPASRPSDRAATTAPHANEQDLRSAFCTAPPVSPPPPRWRKGPTQPVQPNKAHASRTPFNPRLRCWPRTPRSPRTPRNLERASSRSGTPASDSSSPSRWESDPPLLWRTGPTQPAHHDNKRLIRAAPPASLPPWRCRDGPTRMAQYNNDVHSPSSPPSPSTPRTPKRAIHRSRATLQALPLPPCWESGPPPLLKTAGQPSPKHDNTRSPPSPLPLGRVSPRLNPNAAPWTPQRQPQPPSPETPDQTRTLNSPLPPESAGSPLKATAAPSPWKNGPPPQLYCSARETLPPQQRPNKRRSLRLITPKKLLPLLGLSRDGTDGARDHSPPPPPSPPLSNKRRSMRLMMPKKPLKVLGRLHDGADSERDHAPPPRPALQLPAEPSLPHGAPPPLSPTELRNLECLELVFTHTSNTVRDVFERNNRSYAHTYTDLVDLPAPGSDKRHGTPGKKHAHLAGGTSTIAVPPTVREWWMESRPTTRALPTEENDRVVTHALELVRVLTGPSAARPHAWEAFWGGTYAGFKHLQRQLGVVRDDAVRSRFELRGTGYSGRALARALNGLLLDNLQQWAMRWGELDLHRVHARDAPAIVHKYVRAPGWTELRIVAGQRKHAGDDHHSKGVLFDMLSAFFVPGREPRVWAPGRAQTALVRDVHALIGAGDISCTFYSNRAAVQLTRTSGA